MAGNETVFSQYFSYEKAKKEETHRTASFQLSGGMDNLEIRITTDVSNNWAYFPMALVNETTGEAINFSREVGYWSGRDSDGSWSQGSKKGRALLGPIPGGQWYMIINADSPAPSVKYRVEVVRDVLTWITFWKCFFLLSAPFMWYAFRTFMFEVARWKESDHPYFESE